jgi:hypothetical protein
VGAPARPGHGRRRTPTRRATTSSSGKLLAKQDSQPLVGTLSGDGIEYYRHRKDKKGRRRVSIFNRLIAAKPLHEASVRLLADVLLDQPLLRERLTEYVIEQRGRAAQDTPGVAGSKPSETN